MITADGQYRTSKAQLSRLREALQTFDLKETASRIGDEVLAIAELEALRSEKEILSEQIREYEALRSGAVTVLKANSLEELPALLIRARIAQGLSHGELAKKLDIKEQQIQKYESEEYASANLRHLVQIAEALHLNLSEVAELRPKTPKSRATIKSKIDWGLFPVREMYRRGWFRDIDFVGSMAEAIANSAFLAEAYVRKAMPRRQPAFLRHKAKFGSEMDQYALWAWQCRVLLLAKSECLKGGFQRKKITEGWLKDLAQQSQFSDGPRRAKKVLNDAGISLIIEPHLQKTYLDGAAFLLPDGSPIIGMTLRYDRIDNFWFVLFHEMIHLRKHLRKGKLEDIFDDLEAERDELERETDEQAGNALIPADDWEVALARYLRTEESVKDFAAKQHINPAVVAGRIRQEANNYVILTELVGTGKVRSQFPEVQFGQ